MFTTDFFVNDIPVAVANQAHSGTSFVPEQRGKQEIDGYANTMASFYNKVLDLAGEERKTEAMADLESFRDRYRDRYMRLLIRRAGLVSTMIAGPSNFPAARMNKKSAAYDAANQEFFAWSERVSNKIESKYRGNAAIRTGSADAVEKLEQKIADAEAWQSFMVAANKIIRRKAGSVDEKIDELLALDDTVRVETLRKLLTVTDYMGRLGFESFQLTNNGATIRRMKEQLEKAKLLAGSVTTEKTIGQVRIVDNVEADRLEMYFPTRTSKEVYNLLKSHGFRYTPSKSNAPEACFQAYRGANANCYASSIADAYNAETE